MGWWKSFSHRLQVACTLSISDWLSLAQAWWLLLAFRLALRWLHFDRLDAFTRPTHADAVAGPDLLDRACRLQRLVSLAGRLYPVPMTCLPRALALRSMLRRRGIPCQLRLGVDKSVTGIYAHAWVEVAGQAVGEPDDIPLRFRALARANGSQS